MHNKVLNTVHKVSDRSHCTWVMFSVVVAISEYRFLQCVFNKAIEICIDIQITGLKVSTSRMNLSTQQQVGKAAYCHELRKLNLPKELLIDRLMRPSRPDSPTAAQSVWACLAETGVFVLAHFIPLGCSRSIANPI